MAPQRGKQAMPGDEPSAAHSAEMTWLWTLKQVGKEAAVILKKAADLPGMIIENCLKSTGCPRSLL